MMSKLMNLLMESGILEEILRKALRFRKEDGSWMYRALSDREKSVLITLGSSSSCLPSGGGQGRILSDHAVQRFEKLLLLNPVFMKLNSRLLRFYFREPIHVEIYSYLLDLSTEFEYIMIYCVSNSLSPMN